MQELGSRKSYTAEQCEAQLQMLNNEKQQWEQRRPTPFTVHPSIPGPEHAQGRTTSIYPPRIAVTTSG